MQRFFFVIWYIACLISLTFFSIHLQQPIQWMINDKMEAGAYFLHAFAIILLVSVLKKWCFFDDVLTPWYYNFEHKAHFRQQNTIIATECLILCQCLMCLKYWTIYASFCCLYFVNERRYININSRGIHHHTTSHLIISLTILINDLISAEFIHSLLFLKWPFLWMALQRLK